jgi:hypothetical protein
MTPMQQQPSDAQRAADDRWLDVLAGRATASDPDTITAAALRQHLDEEVAADAVAGLQTPHAREQAFKRLTNLMEAQAPAPRQAAARPPEPAGLWQRIMNWLLPGEGARPLRLGGAAAGVAALALVVTLVVQQGPGDGYDPSMKSPPPAPAPAPVQPRASSPLNLVVVPVADPVASALALQAELRALGLESSVFPLGRAAQLSAPVPAGRQAELAQLLAAKGIAWAGGSSLELEYRAAP